MKLKAYRLYAESLGHDLLTLLDFFNVYAPVSDANSPNHYALYVASHLQTDINQSLKELFINPTSVGVDS